MTESKPKPKPLSWTPIHDEETGTYCAPACGSRCKFADYLKAAQSADSTCAALGKGWRAHVWENMGWHWRVYLPVGAPGKLKTYSRDIPRIELYPDRTGKEFRASLESLGQQRRGLECVGTTKAIRSLVSVLEAEVREAQSALSAVQESLR